MTTQKGTQPTTTKQWLTKTPHLNHPIKGVTADQHDIRQQNQLWAGIFGNGGGGKKKKKSIKRYRRSLNKKRKTKKFRKRKSYKTKIKRKNKRKKTKKNIKKVYFGGTDQCNKTHSGDTVNDQRDIALRREPAITNITNPHWSPYNWKHFSGNSAHSHNSSVRASNMLNAYNNTTNNNPMCPE
jgi:hypothetical protein